MIGGAIAGARGEAPPPAPPTPAPDSGNAMASAMGGSMGDMAPLLTYHAYSAANWLAMHAAATCTSTARPSEQLGWLAVNSRRHAACNALAVYREPMTLDDYIDARAGVVDPFGLLDCDVPGRRLDRRRRVGARPRARLPEPGRCASESIGRPTGAAPGWVNRLDYPKMASVEAAAEMWSSTDLTPTDVDVAELYDGFTFLTFALARGARVLRRGRERDRSSRAAPTSRSAAAAR